MNKITDTDRLNWFLKHVRIDDVGNGDDPYCPGPVVSDYEIEDKLCNEGFRQAYKLECGVVDDLGLQVEPRPDWERRCILASIDEAIRKERHGNPS